MKLGIIILHWKNKTLSLKLLNRLLSWDLKDTVLILVQNESNQDQFPELTHNKLVKVNSIKNAGYGGGMNLGLSKLREYSVDCTLLVNPDVEIDKKVVEQLKDHLKHNPNTFAVGPKIIEIFKEETKIYTGGRNIAQFVNTRIEEVEESPRTTKLSVDYVIGAAILINNRHLNKTGYFDEDFFFSGEVAELCYRATQQGFKCQTLLEITAHHHLEDATLRASLYKYYNFRNRFVFIRKHPNEKKYLQKWYWILLKELGYNLSSFNLSGLITTFWIMHDVFFKITGNRNDKFIG